MHTFSPARMWIAGLHSLEKPLLHLHTQFNQDLLASAERRRNSRLLKAPDFTKSMSVVRCRYSLSALRA